MYNKGKKRLQELQCAVEALREEARTGLASNEVRRSAIKAELENNRLLRERARAIVQANRIENDKYASSTAHTGSTSTPNETSNKNDFVWADGDYPTSSANFLPEKQEIIAPELWSAKMLDYKSLCAVANECCTDIDEEEGNNRNTIIANERHHERNTVFLTEAEVKSDYMENNKNNSNVNNVYSSCKGTTTTEFSSSSTNENKSKEAANGSVMTTPFKDCSLALPEQLYERGQERHNLQTITFCHKCHACCIIASKQPNNASFADERDNNKKVYCEVCGYTLHNTNLVNEKVGKTTLSMQTNNLQENVLSTSQIVECAKKHDCKVCERWKQSLRGLLFMQ